MEGEVAIFGGDAKERTKRMCHMRELIPRLQGGTTFGANPKVNKESAPHLELIPMLEKVPSLGGDPTARQ